MKKFHISFIAIFSLITPAYAEVAPNANPNTIDLDIGGEPFQTKPLQQEEPAKSYPSFSGAAVHELQIEDADHSGDPDNERTRTFFRTEVAPRLQFNEHFFIDGNAVFEPVQDPSPGPGDSTFENEGLFVEELKFNYETGPWGFVAGKFNPKYGVAWDYGRGIWSEDFAEDYEITEKIGVGASYAFETANYGKHTLAVSTFFADTSFLAESLITKRERLRLDDGGSSNTEDPSSFVVSLEGEDAVGIKDLSYILAYRHLAGADADIDDATENGIVGTLKYKFPITRRLKGDILAELTHINNFNGTMDDAIYYYANYITTLDDHWNVTLGFTQRNTEVADGDDMNDHLFQVSGGYLFDNGLSLEAGWRNEEVADITTDILGGLVRYSYEF